MDVSSIRIRDKEYDAREVRWEGGDIVVKVEGLPKRVPGSCCGYTYVYSHCKGKIRKVLHHWSKGKRIYLGQQRKRWRCLKCGHFYSDGEDLIMTLFQRCQGTNP